VTSTGSPIVTDQTANTVESVQRRSKVENSSSGSREAVVTSRLESRSLVREESRTLVQPSPQPAPQPAPQLTQPTSRHSSASARNGTVPVDQVDRVAQHSNGVLRVQQEREVETGNNNLVSLKNQNGDRHVSSSEPPSLTSVEDGSEFRDLRKAKRDLDLRLLDREDQVEELAQQVEALLSVKARLEGELSQSRKEHKREVADKEDELEDSRASAGKKIKILEQQLEAEHEERLAFLRERHELEGKILTLKDAIDHGNSEEEVRKLKKDLKRSKALLKDAQLMLEKSSQEGMNKIVLRQLKNQLEDAEFARTAALKAKANTELELVEVNSMLEDTTRVKTELEEKLVKVGRERSDVAQQLRETEEEVAELMKKYKAAVAACSVDQITIQDQSLTIQQLELERNRAKELLAEMEVKLEHCRGEQVSVSQHRRLELQLREMENKLELERTSKARLELQQTRLKEVIDGLQKEAETLRTRERSSFDEVKKMSKQQREAKEQVAGLQGKEVEWAQRRGDMEKLLEVAESETLAVRTELKVAQRRIEDLQAAIQGDMDTTAGSSDGESDGEGLGDTELWLEQVVYLVMLDVLHCAV